MKTRNTNRRAKPKDSSHVCAVRHPGVLQIAVPLALLGWQACGPRHEHHRMGSETDGGMELHLCDLRRRPVAGCSLVCAARTDADQHLARRAHPARCVQAVASAGPSLPVDDAGSSRQCTAAMCVAGLGFALEGRTPPAETAVDLAFPLRSGHYYIANGGSTELVNAHVRMLTGERFRRYRGVELWPGRRRVESIRRPGRADPRLAIRHNTRFSATRSTHPAKASSCASKTACPICGPRTSTARTWQVIS